MFLNGVNKSPPFKRFEILSKTSRINEKPRSNKFRADSFEILSKINDFGSQ